MSIDLLRRPAVAPCVIGQRHERETEFRSLSRQFHEAIRDAVEKSSVVHDVKIAANASQCD